jgi:hypothetical protein
MPDARLVTNAHFVTFTHQRVVTSFGNAVSNSIMLDGTDEMSTAQKIGKVRLSFAAGSIDAGKMFLDKRRVYF